MTSSNTLLNSHRRQVQPVGAYRCPATSEGKPRAVVQPDALSSERLRPRSASAPTTRGPSNSRSSICEIPAPPFKEAARAPRTQRRLEALGLRNVRIDPIGNVIARAARDWRRARRRDLRRTSTRCSPRRPTSRVKREGTMLRGPGIGDDCRGLAVVLAVARALRARERASTRGTIYFVGNVGEEGPGNLRGVRHLFDAGAGGQDRLLHLRRRHRTRPHAAAPWAAIATR